MDGGGVDNCFQHIIIYVLDFLATVRISAKNDMFATESFVPNLPEQTLPPGLRHCCLMNIVVYLQVLSVFMHGENSDQLVKLMINYFLG